MKKTLIALAAVAATGAAMAQSSVTIYGKIDLGFAKANKIASGNSTLAGAPAGDTLTMQEAAGSRLGFRGVEDLGGGLKAAFNAEHRFRPDTGTVTGAEIPTNVYWQQVWVGLQGGFGELRLGRDYAPMFYVSLAGDPFGYDTVGQAGAAHNQLGMSPVRFDNMISYKTPSMGGVTATVAYAPKETSAAGSKNSWGLNVVYQGGPLYAGLGYENAGVQLGNIYTGAQSGITYTNNTSLSPTFSSGVKSSVYVLTVAYDFGVARPSLSYASGKVKDASSATTADRDNWTLGVTAPVGPGELKALYAIRDNNSNNTDIKKFAVGYHYPLSKRTKLYADVGTAKETNRARRTAFDFGLQHNF